MATDSSSADRRPDDESSPEHASPDAPLPDDEVPAGDAADAVAVADQPVGDRPADRTPAVTDPTVEERPAERLTEQQPTGEEPGVDRPTSPLDPSPEDEAPDQRSANPSAASEQTPLLEPSPEDEAPQLSVEGAGRSARPDSGTGERPTVGPADAGGGYERYVNETAGLFREDGEFGHFWNREVGEFDQERWDGASLEEKKQLAVRMETVRAEIFGSTAAAVSVVKMEPGEFGAYMAGDLRMEIGDWLSCEDTVETMVHEGYHAYQHDVVRDPDLEHSRKEAWQENELNYITYESNPDAYRQQPIEADAFSFEAQFMNSLESQLRSE